MTNYLTLEQVRSIAAAVAPHFGPMIDCAATGAPIEDVYQAALPMAVAYQPLTDMICAAVEGPDAAKWKLWEIGRKASPIIVMTLAVNGRDEVFGAIIEELSNHSLMLKAVGMPV